jgi:hypothetical protein
LFNEIKDKIYFEFVIDIHTLKFVHEAYQLVVQDDQQINP